MMKVANKKTVRNLAFRQIRTSNSRNLFAALAIILTTVLVAAVFTIGISLMDGTKQMMIRTSGRSAEVSFQYLTEDEAMRVAAHPLFKKYGLSKIVAMTSEGVWKQAPCEIRTADENFAEIVFSSPTTGRLPVTENEVAVKTWMLDMMGLPHELGQVFPLDFELNGVQHSMELTVCGFWDSTYNLQPYGTAFISDQLADKLLTDVDAEQGRLTGNYSGVIQIQANLNGKQADLNKNLDIIVADTGISDDAVKPQVNQAYTKSSINGGAAAVMAVIILIIIISGYLLIYNVFYISVIKDIKFYGLLKTIGTTKRQIGRIVNMQALILCFISIPIGLLFGYFLGVVLLPVLLSVITVDYIAVPPNPWIFILAASLSLATVLISCNNPARIAGKVSPVEAVRFTGIATDAKKKTKRGTLGANIKSMAFSNLFRNKKKAILVIASISIGLILFNTVYTFVNSYDINKYLRSFINGDFLIADETYFNFANGYTPSHTLTEETLSEVAALSGVDKIAKVYYEQGFEKIEGELKDKMNDYYRNDPLMKQQFPTEAEMEAALSNMNEGYFVPAQIYGFDDYWLNKLEENVTEGTFDKEKFLSGNYIIIGFDGQDLFDIGDIVDFNIGSENGDKQQYEVMAKVNVLYSLSAHFISMPGYSAYLPSSEFEKMENPNIMSATIIADEKYLDTLQTEIADILTDNPDVDFRSRADYIAEMKSENGQFALIGFTLCVIILLIGVLNFANTTMTNIFSRRQELAMLQSIGMTGKQGKKMLVLECLYYVGIAFTIFVTLGYGLSYVLVSAFAAGSAAYTFSFTFVPLLICFPMLVLIAFVLPLGAYKNVSQHSVVERLRETAG